MKLIDANVNVFDDFVLLDVTRKYICCDGELANYSHFILRFSNLATAMRYVSQMTRMITDNDYHVTIHVVGVL